MNLWPFSKKNSNPLEGHSELPPGVMLAEDDGSAPPPFPPSMDIRQEASNAWEDPENAHQQLATGESIVNFQLDAAVGSPALYPNSRLIDLFTPPATPDIGWTQAEITAAPSTESILSPLTPPAHWSFHPESAGNPPQDPIEESFALTEAKNLTPDPGFEQQETPGHWPSEGTPAKTAETDDLLSAPEPDSSNVVPFPLRQKAFSVEPPNQSMTLVTDVTVFEETDLAPSMAVDSLNEAAPAETLSWNPDVIPDHAFADLTPPTLWDPASEPENTQASGLYDFNHSDLNNLETKNHDSDSLLGVGSPEITEDSGWTAGGLAKPTRDAMDLNDSITLEPANTPLDAYGSILGLMSEAPGEWPVETGSAWSTEEPEALLPQDIGSYDLGHYEDLDNEPQLLVLETSSESLESVAAASSAYFCETAEGQPEAPVDLPAFSMPEIALPQPQPLHGEIVQPERQKHASLGQLSASEAINNFSQKVILEESRFIKHRIDDLIECYFAQKYPAD